MRDKSLFLLIGAFLLLLVLFGGRKGVNTVITLIFTTASVFLVMIPAIIKGVNIYPVSYTHLDVYKRQALLRLALHHHVRLRPLRTVL